VTKIIEKLISIEIWYFWLTYLFSKASKHPISLGGQKYGYNHFSSHLSIFFYISESLQIYFPLYTETNKHGNSLYTFIIWNKLPFDEFAGSRASTILFKDFDTQIWRTTFINEQTCMRYFQMFGH